MRIWVMCCTGCCSGVVRCGVFGVVCVGCRCCLLLCFCLGLSSLDFCVFFFCIFGCVGFSWFFRFGLKVCRKSCALFMAAWCFWLMVSGYFE